MQDLHTRIIHWALGLSRLFQDIQVHVLYYSQEIMSLTNQHSIHSQVLCTGASQINIASIVKCCVREPHKST